MLPRSRKPGGDQTTNQELVQRYVTAQAEFDYETLEKLRHAEWTATYPQSGERLKSSAADRRMIETYPGGAPRLQAVGGRVVGTADRWVTTPLGGAYRVGGDGDNWWGEFRVVYPDRSTWFTVTLMELRDGKVWRETQYFAKPFEAPEWRRDLVERIDQP